jgi:hypothetical protein
LPLVCALVTTRRSDLIWSDPFDPEAADETLEEHKGDGPSDGWFAENATRQCSVVYGCVRLVGLCRFAR